MSEAPEVDSSPLQDSQEWNRLSPISVVFFLVKSIARFLKDALPGLAPLAVVIFNSDDKTWATGLILGGIGLLIVVSSVLQYWFFRFKVEADKLLINEGVFKKQHRSILFERVQNINILQPFYFKPFKLVTLQLETAGSRGNEADLAGLKVEYAESIKHHALDVKKHASPVTEDTDNAQEPTDIIATADTRALMKYGLTNNGMYWFFVILAPVFGAIDEIMEKWIGEDNVKAAVDALGGGPKGGIALAAIVVLTSILLMFLFSIAGAILRFHKYLLTDDNETLRRKSGLLTTHEESAKHSKIQALVQQTNIFGVKMKVENLVLKQASNQQQGGAQRNQFVVPTRTPEESEILKAQIFQQTPEEIELHAIDKRYIMKTWSLWMLLPSIWTILACYHNHWWTVGVWAGLALFFFWAVHKRWRNFGYGIGKNFAVSRRGFWGYRRVEFPLFKVQRVKINQSPLQRRRNLATLKIIMASEHITIPYVPMEHANAWFNQISYAIESTDKNWF